MFVCLFVLGGRKGVGVTRIEAFRVDNGRVTRLVRNSRRTQALPLWVDKGRYESKLDSRCFEFTQPLRIVLGLKANISASLSHSAHKSRKINHHFSTTKLKYFA